MNRSKANDPWLHVVAAVIQGADQRFLLSKRLAHKAEGGKWEFPGGKVEPGESACIALQRELWEELGISVPKDAMTHFLDVYHPSVAPTLKLDIWWVQDFKGEAEGREQQKIGWFTYAELMCLSFPEANEPILKALTRKLVSS